MAKAPKYRLVGIKGKFAFKGNHYDSENMPEHVLKSLFDLGCKNVVEAKKEESKP